MVQGVRVPSTYETQNMTSYSYLEVLCLCVNIPHLGTQDPVGKARGTFCNPCSPWKTTSKELRQFLAVTDSQESHFLKFFKIRIPRFEEQKHGNPPT